MSETSEDDMAVAITKKHFNWLQKNGMAKEYCILPLFFEDLKDGTVVALKEGLDEMVYRAFLLGRIGGEVDEDMTTSEITAFALGRREVKTNEDIPTMADLLFMVRSRIDIGEELEEEEEVLNVDLASLKPHLGLSQDAKQ